MRTQTKRTTIYDLAELAGTSASAVSAVLNGNWKKRRISVKLAEKITKLAEEQGYALNMQASVLRRDRSKIIGMIVPKYDNRYFASIVEQFEMLARARGLFPIITCTQRDPALEVEAARAMLSYQVDCLVATGATDPDRIVDLCAAAGVRTINLDLPGSRAPFRPSTSRRWNIWRAIPTSRTWRRRRSGWRSCGRPAPCRTIAGSRPRSTPI